VLWTKVNALEWETRGGFDTRADCERERGKSVEGVHEGTGGKEFVVLNACLPDTIDPRGLGVRGVSNHSASSSPVAPGAQNST
jgi:hypothetical protein